VVDPATGAAPRRRATRLTRDDREWARALFALLAGAFGETGEPLSDAYLDRLLGRPEFWAVAALAEDGSVVGGLTAHTLPMTRAEAAEVFIFDIAVRPDHRRRGVGRQLVAALRDAAAAQGIADVFVAADDDDQHALDFYRALGGAPSPVTIFTFSDDGG
jgi:aminoglycoside 3-N-acetyltransferase I